MMNFYTNCVVLGNTILYRGIQDGVRVNQSVPYRPSVFIPANKATKYQTLGGRFVERLQPGDIRETRNFIKKYEDVHNFQMFGNLDFHCCYISDNHPGQIEYDIKQIVVANIDIEVYAKDGFPEPEFAAAPINAISMKVGEKIYVFGMPYAKGQGFKSEDPNVKYFEFRDETSLLQCFLGVWESISPDIVTGWNVQFFDVPYLVNRITKVLGTADAKRLSPWKSFGTRRTNYKNQQLDVVTIHGISILDYIELYRKFQPRPESEKLNYVAYLEVGEKKIPYVGSLAELYETDYQTFIDYNIHDSVLVGKIDDKLQLINMVLATAYDAKVNFTDVFTQVRMWDSIGFNELRKNGIVLPEKKENEKIDYPGGYVKEVQKGQHKWVESFDVTSEYPSLIIEHNISPETIVEGAFEQIVRIYKEGEVLLVDCERLLKKEFTFPKLQTENLTISPAGFYFSRDRQGFLPRILSRMMEDRDRFKKQMVAARDQMTEIENKIKVSGSTPELQAELNIASKEHTKYYNWQLAKKVQLNSAYGALGNEWFRFYDVRLASSVTIAGQTAIQWVARDLNKYLNDLLATNNKDYVVAIDTDSVYLVLDELVKKVFKDKEPDTMKIVEFLDKAAREKIEKVIQKSFQEYASYFNSHTQRLRMKREAIASRGIWIVKKRYALLAHDIEGKKYPEGKLKIQGIEAVKSNTPEICRQAIKDAILVMMKKGQNDLYDLVENFKNIFNQASIVDIAKSSQCNNLEKYSDKDKIYGIKCPQHVKGALIYNELLKRKGLAKKYPEVREGDRVKTIALRQPNAAQDNTIAFPEILPPEFGLEKAIDREAQFKTIFITPLSAILDAINWQVERVSNLDALF